MNEYIVMLDNLIEIAQKQQPIGNVGGKPYYSIEFDYIYNKFVELFDKMDAVSYEELEEENEKLYEENNGLKDEVEMLEQRVTDLLEQIADEDE